MKRYSFFSDGNFLKVVYGDSPFNSKHGFTESHFLKKDITNIHLNEDKQEIYVVVKSLELTFPISVVDQTIHTGVDDARKFRDLLISILNQ